MLVVIGKQRQEDFVRDPAEFFFGAAADSIYER